MGDITITAADLRRLFGETNNEDPVLYVQRDEETGTPKGLDVWCAAYVPSGAVVIHRHELPDPSEFSEFAESLQDDVNEIVANLA
jgi:hypothetical protein